MNISALLKVSRNERDITWLRKALQTALKLEFSTLPPYLIALWTINDRNSFAYQSIRNQIAEEEMLHMGLVCNLIVAMGGEPDLTSSDGVPTYPGPLPGMVQSDLEVSLARYSPEALQTFLAIEYPENPPIEIGHDPKPDAQANDCAKTIGQFYTEILEEFQDLQDRGELPEFDNSQQLKYSVDFQNDPDRKVFLIESLKDVERAISIIKRQGEGTGTSPEDTGVEDLSHYYRYLELDRERRIRFINGQFVYGNKPTDQIKAPAEVYSMATIPENGYQRDDVPSDDVWGKITKFDKTYSKMLLEIERAWTHSEAEGGGTSSLDNAVRETMFELTDDALEILREKIPNGSGERYGPCFRFDPAVSLPDGNDPDNTGGINPFPTWEIDIKNFFTAGDIGCMNNVGNPPFDLASYADVFQYADQILERVSLPEEDPFLMPQGGPRWHQDKIDTFQNWITNGKPKVPTWDDNIRDLFESLDVNCMKNSGSRFDLSNYDDVVAKASDILNRVSRAEGASGVMPPQTDRHWADNWVATFKYWSENGMPKSNDNLPE